jgi:hypothetical protein
VKFPGQTEDRSLTPWKLSGGIFSNSYDNIPNFEKAYMRHKTETQESGNISRPAFGYEHSVIDFLPINLDGLWHGM